ncbi:DUF2891 domain-containing protein [Salinisphaera orenii]|uniref:DUF2891 domain-containing protein n=1 Tax=Salinisphaera orenii TaxID=856731 RepID=UPI000DBEA514
MFHLDTKNADYLATIALGHVEREFPNHITHMMNGAEDAARPCHLHPIFFGSFDWHSCVHSYWLLARLAAGDALSPDRRNAVIDLFERRITAAAVAAETAYFDPPGRAGFERPYGWAWLVKLASELARHPEPSLQSASRRLAPLADRVLSLWHAYWPKQSYPIRAGVHSNSAFATVLGLDYAEAAGDEQMAMLLRQQARAWYGDDRNQPAWEPGGDEFLSPALIEALAMQRVLTHSEFSDWFRAYLPRLEAGEPATLFEPALVTDRTDGKLAHLDGLNLTRGWCWYELADNLPAGDPRISIMQETGERHLEAGLAHLETDYMGSHWLSSFALLALEAVSGN